MKYNTEQFFEIKITVGSELYSQIIRSFYFKKIFFFIPYKLGKFRCVTNNSSFNLLPVLGSGMLFYDTKHSCCVSFNFRFPIQNQTISSIVIRLSIHLPFHRTNFCTVMQYLKSNAFPYRLSLQNPSLWHDLSQFLKSRLSKKADKKKRHFFNFESSKKAMGHFF